ncbi:cation:proton antiporter [Neoehrlichia mikurensis]|nr:cation:proton antiporter [Neoehrlichia mikurensis]QXK93426.1 cation:proton antiporter [Neoehrlichia mikurensis]
MRICTLFYQANILMIIAILLPFICAALILILKDLSYAKQFITLISSSTLIIVIALIYSIFVKDKNAFLLDYHFLYPQIHISFNIEILGMMFSILASFLWLVTNIYTFSYMYHNDLHNKKQNLFYACFATSIGCTICIAFSGNLITLFIFYELLTICTYPLITYYIDNNSLLSGRYYIQTLLCTSIMLFFPAIIITFNISGTLDFHNGGILKDNISAFFLILMIAFFSYGIGKSAIMPTHFWLPKAMVAPTPVSALLHAVAVVKSGIFTILKIIVYIIGVQKIHEIVAPEYNILMYVSAITVIIGSLIAMQQNNLKKLLAYSTISQLSYVIVAASLYTNAAIKAAVFQLISHALGKITLFFSVGAIYTSTKKKNINEIHGIGKSMPITMIAFTIGALTMIGIPPTSGFWGKFYILSEALHQRNFFVMSILILSTLLNTMYFMSIIYKAFFIPPVTNHIKEAPKFMLISMLITSTCILILFFKPSIIYHMMSFITFQ